LGEDLSDASSELSDSFCFFELFDLLVFLLLLSFDLLFFEFNDFLPFLVTYDLSSPFGSFDLDFYFFKSSFEGLFFCDFAIFVKFLEIDSFLELIFLSR
jgi:hypothetical protein